MYGKAPAPPDNVVGTVDHHDAGYFGGKGTMDLVTIHFGPPGTPPIHLLLVVPHKAKGRRRFSWRSISAAITPSSTIRRSRSQIRGCRTTARDASTTGPPRPAAERRLPVWSLEYAVERGYAIATFYDGDVDPDKNDPTDGVQPHFYKPGQTQPAADDWGTIRAWAWGASRVVDYLLTRPTSIRTASA